MAGKGPRSDVAGLGRRFSDAKRLNRKVAHAKCLLQGKVSISVLIAYSGFDSVKAMTGSKLSDNQLARVKELLLDDRPRCRPFGLRIGDRLLALRRPFRARLQADGRDFAAPVAS